MKKLLAVLLTAIIGLCACSAKEETKKITVCLDWTPNTNHTGMYVALANGYYKEAGLEVEIVQPPEDGATLMCASGQAQFAVDCQDTMAPSLDQDNPLGVTAVAALIQHNTSGIISRKGEGMDTPRGLENHTYSTWETPVELKMIQNIVEKDGGDFAKVNLIPNNIYDEAGALSAHQTDAIWIFYGWGGINAKQQGLDFDYFYFKDIAPEFDYYTPVLIANNDFLQSDPETAKAFLEATRKGYEFAIENPADAAKLLIEGDTTGSLSGSAAMVKESQEYLAQQYIADAKQWGYIDKDRWNAFYTWLYQNGLTTHDLTGQGFTNDYLR